MKNSKKLIPILLANYKKKGSVANNAPSPPNPITIPEYKAKSFALI